MKYARSVPLPRTCLGLWTKTDMKIKVTALFEWRQYSESEVTVLNKMFTCSTFLQPCVFLYLTNSEKQNCPQEANSSSVRKKVTNFLYLFEQGVLHFKGWSFTMGPTCCTPTSVNTYQPKPRGIPVERMPLFIWRQRPCNIRYKQLQTQLEGFSLIPVGLVHHLNVNRVPN
jgi:hypothetical protein